MTQAHEVGGESFQHPGYEPVDAGDAARVRAALDTTSVDGTDTEFAPEPDKKSADEAG